MTPTLVGSTNCAQLVADHITVGSSLDEVRDLATGIFWQNFPQLRDAATVAVEKRLAETIQLIQGHFPSHLSDAVATELREPDAQVVLLEVLRSSVRATDEGGRKVLAGLLARRLKSAATDLKRILYNEAIAVTPKLTQNQLNVLSVIALMREITNSRARNWDDFNGAVGGCLAKLINTSPKVHDVTHLEYLGCISHSHDLTQPITTDFTERFPQLFQLGVSDDELLECGLADETRSLLFEPSDQSGKYLLRMHPDSVANLISDPDAEGSKETLKAIRRLFRVKKDPEILIELERHPAVRHFIDRRSAYWVWDYRLTPLGMVLAATYLDTIYSKQVNLDGYFEENDAEDSEPI